MSIYIYIYIYIHTYTHICTYAHMHTYMDPLRGSSVNLGSMQRRFARPLRRDDTHESRSGNTFSHLPYSALSANSVK